MMNAKREENAIVLDYLPYGKSGEAQREPVAQLLGDLQFTLLEAIPKAGLTLSVGEKVYIGRGERDKIAHIRGRVTYQQMTNAAQQELERQIKAIVLLREPEFVQFLNRAGAISIRVHALEQLPSIGKKNLHHLLDERERKPFESFADAHGRLPQLGDVAHIFVERIIRELKGDEKYFLFVKLPSREERERY